MTVPGIRGVRVIRRRSRTALRHLGLRPYDAYEALVRTGRSLPIPARARVAVSSALLRRPWQVSVPLDKLLLGAQNGWTATAFADQTGEVLWASTPLLRGPHVALLRLAEVRGELSDAEILDSPYGRFGLRNIAASGRYFWATDPAGVLNVARSFIARYEGREPRRPTRANQSRPTDPVLAAPIQGTDYYQILDGHHRLAIAAVRGEHAARATVKWMPVMTPLQRLLTRMSWLDGSRELYQPIDAPELRQRWTLVRRCSDRLEKMTAFLGERDLLPPGTGTYLDVASCYGWFVRQMQVAGYQANGIERDPLAVPLGRAVYGMDGTEIRTGDCVEVLAASDRTWDVVSCFSLLHHFVLGRGSTSAEELLSLLDRNTGHVLFLDMGQEHEEWFRQSLAGWNASTIARFLDASTSFDEIVDLGPDEDARPPYAGNYGRHLFACLRA